MAIVVNDAQNLLTLPMFLARVQYEMCVTASNVYSEASGTVGHVKRAAYASLVANNPTGYLPNVAQMVVTQLPLASTNIINSGTDVDTTNASIANFISAVWNLLAGA